MADQLRLRGGDTATSSTFVGALREVTVDTGLNSLRIHDGVTPGGHLVELSASATASRSAVAADSANNLETVRAALQQAIDNAIVARDAAIAAGDTAVTDAVTTAYTAADVTTLSTANAYTDTKVIEVLGGAPDLLDTLNELAEAIGDDADFITTINNSIAALQADVDANEAAANTSITNAVTTANNYTDTAISNLTNGADAALDTLKEIGDALSVGDQSVTDALTASITTESTSRAAADIALSARIDLLEEDATTATAVAAVQSDVDQNEADADAAISAVEVRVTAVEAGVVTEEAARIAADAATLTSANSYTDTTAASGDAVVTNAMTALVTTETANRGAADSALSARIDVLEADPTTATALTAAIAGVQADVDQNEADADIAISAEETRALAAETAITAAHTAEEAARDQLNLHAGLAFGQLYVGDLIVA